VSSNLERLFGGLEALYGADTGIDICDFVIPNDGNESDIRELLLVRESAEGVAEAALVLDRRLLSRIERMPADRILSDASLADALPVIEGLSHLLYLLEAARTETPISALELETQAEVDKLAVCLLQRWPRARREFGPLVDRIYHRFRLAPHVDAGLARRYHAANRLALRYSRRLRPHVEAGRLADLRRALRRFWHGSMGEKHHLAT
jgi:hypothetical protein